MILSRRNINVIRRICGPVSVVREFEKKWYSCDDNALGGKLNQRFIQLKLSYEEVYHTIGGYDFIEKDFDEKTVDFACPIFQIKTYTGERLPNDVNKMRKIDALWRSCDESISDLYQRMMSEWYDKSISILPYSKDEWFKLSEEE